MSGGGGMERRKTSFPATGSSPGCFGRKESTETFCSLRIQSAGAGLRPCSFQGSQLYLNPPGCQTSPSRRTTRRVSSQACGQEPWSCFSCPGGRRGSRTLAEPAPARRRLTRRGEQLPLAQLAGVRVHGAARRGRQLRRERCPERETRPNRLLPARRRAPPGLWGSAARALPLAAEERAGPPRSSPRSLLRGHRRLARPPHLRAPRSQALPGLAVPLRLAPHFRVQPAAGSLPPASALQRSPPGFCICLFGWPFQLREHHGILAFSV